MDFLDNLFVGRDTMSSDLTDLSKIVVKSGFTIGSALAEKVSGLVDDVCDLLFD